MKARAHRMVLGGLLCVTAILALTPSSALGAAPVLASVTVTAGQATVRWSLPPCVEARLVETATNSTTNLNGYFDPANFYSFDVPGNVASDTSLVVNDPLNGSFLPGTYYAHIGGVDTSKPPPTKIEFSNVVTFTVDSSKNGGGTGLPGATTPCPKGSGGGGGGGGGGGAGTVTKAAPFGSLTYSRSQSIRRLLVTAHITQAGILKAVGSVRVPGSARVYRFRAVTRTVGGATDVKLRLRLSKHNLRLVQGAIRRAKKKGRRLTANVTVTGRTATAARSQTASIKLKP